MTRRSTPLPSEAEPNGYLTRAELAVYAKVSERQLQAWTNLPPAAALPCYRFGKRAVRYKRSEYDAWFAQYRMRGKPALVGVLRALGLDPLHVPDTRQTHQRRAIRAAIGAAGEGRTVRAEKSSQ